MSVLRKVHTEFDKRLDGLGHLVVAGGAVRDTMMVKQPKDFDLFLLGAEFTAATRSQIAERLGDLKVIKPLEWHNSEPYLVTTVFWYGQQIQVMCNPAPTVHALLDTFDWNVCLFAFDGTFYSREETANIAPGEELRLQAVTFPLSTLRRGFRFSERFQMKLRRDDIINLCERVAKLKAESGPRGATPDRESLAANFLVEDGIG